MIVIPFTKKTSLRVLHVRQSGPDLVRRTSWGIQPDTEVSLPTRSESVSTKNYQCRIPQCDWGVAVDEPSSNYHGGLTMELHELGQWAFGPEGISSLRVLAFGDFSHKGRFAKSSVLLCKESKTEQILHGQHYRRLR